MESLALNQKYEGGKRTICFWAIIVTLVGFILDVLTYYPIYTNIQNWLQGTSIIIVVTALLFFIADRRRWYVFSFGLLSYTVIINIILTSVFIQTLNTFKDFTLANILSRDILFVILYIVLSGFILGRKHIFIQGMLLIGLVFFCIFVRNEPFFVENAAIYIIASIGFLVVLYFFVSILNDLIKDLEESNIRTNILKQQETEKNQTLLNYQNSILSISKDELLYNSNLEYIFEKICQTVSKNLKVSRVSIWDLAEGNSLLLRRYLYEPNKGNNELVTLVRKDFPQYFNAIESCSFIMANDAGEHPDTKEFKDVYLKPLSILSMMDCPIIIDGNTVGVICCENQHTTINWTTEDAIYLQSLAEHLSICYKNLEIKGLLNQVQKTNFDLIEKGNEIETMNEKLNSLNEELKTLNDSLEATVKKRTFELETQNAQLSEYAFINSHLLRAPLARILGLTNLLSMEATSINDIEMLKKLKISSDELDSIIRKISDVLHIGNNLSRSEVEALIDRTFYKEKLP